MCTFNEYNRVIELMMDHDHKNHDVPYQNLDENEKVKFVVE